MSVARCTHKGCQQLARWRVGWRAYAAGYPREACNSIVGVLSLVVCDEHRAGLDIKELLPPEGRERIASAIAAMGRVPLDFDTAEFCCVDLLDPFDFPAPPKPRMH